MWSIASFVGKGICHNHTHKHTARCQRFKRLRTHSCAEKRQSFGTPTSSFKFNHRSSSSSREITSRTIDFLFQMIKMCNIIMICENSIPITLHHWYGFEASTSTTNILLKSDLAHLKHSIDTIVCYSKYSLECRINFDIPVFWISLNTVIDKLYMI